MKSIVNLIKRNFELSQHQSLSVIFGILALLLLLISYSLFSYWTDQREQEFVLSEYLAPEEHLQELNLEKAKIKKSYFKQKETEHFSVFNPNEATVEELVKNGFPKYAARNLVNFRNKGKVFKYKEDIASVYGLSESLYNKLEDFIDLPSLEDEELSNSFDSIYEKPVEKESKVPKVFKKEIEHFDINLAQSQDLTQVYGIGKIFADRIIKYRDALGGFYSKEQIKTTYGLPDSTYQELSKYIYIESVPKKVKINSVDLAKWKSPVIKFNKKKALLAYIAQHGPVKDINDLKKVRILNDSDIASLAPYLDFSTTE